MVQQVRLLLDEALRQDSIKLHFRMFGGGLFASLTPWTCPVLPWTDVGCIANRWRIFMVSLSLVTGMALVYATLGRIVTPAVGGTFGLIMGNGLTLYAISVFYLMMGLSLLGYLQGALILIAGRFAGFLSKLPMAGGRKTTVKKGFALLIILTAGLMFVLVGLYADFPNLTQSLAGSYSPVPQPSQEPKLAATTAFPSRAAEKPSEGKAPDFILASLDGTQVTLSSFKGKKGVVLVFFATWCVNCMKEVPEIKKFALAAQKENIEVLAINFKQRVVIVEKFQKSNNINYRILLDSDGAVAIGKYGIKGIPHVVGIDAKGEMIYRGEDLPVKKAEFMQSLNQGL